MEANLGHVVTTLQLHEHLLRNLDPSEIADGLVTTKEAAAFLHLSRSTLYEMMNNGELRYVKLGRSRRIPRKAVIELAAGGLCGGWRAAG